MNASLFGLDGKTAVVTGGATGIGAAVARSLGALGANVVVHYRSWGSPFNRTNVRSGLFARDGSREGVPGWAGALCWWAVQAVPRGASG